MSREWAVVESSHPGSSHRRARKRCQDFYATKLVRVGRGVFLVAAVADGAGGARFGGAGARLAVKSILRRLATTLKRCGGTAEIQRNDMVAALSAVRRTVRRRAGHRPVSDFACTLAVAIIGRDGAAFGQIGDSVIVARYEDTFQTVFWPDNGEFINTTVFLTSDTLEENLRFANHPVRPLDVALFTDGLSTMALNLSARRAHGPFFAPLFKSLRLQVQQRVPLSALRQQLHQFIGSDGVDGRSEDDRTLVLISALGGAHDGR